MAGDNQHTVPRFVQRGFLAPRRKGVKAEQTWVYTPKKPPYLSSIENVGSQRHFYAKPEGGPNLDTEITDLEDGFGAVLHLWRQTDAPSPVEAETAAALISHLSSRTAHFRGAVAHGLKHIAIGAYGLLTDDAAIERVLGLDASQVNERFTSKLSDQLKSNPRIARLGLPAKVVDGAAFVLAKEGMVEALAEHRPKLLLFLAQLFGQAAAMTRSSHNTALRKSLGSTERSERLAERHWSLQLVAGDCVLPDCIVVGLEDDGGYHPLLMAGEDKLRVVIMPVSSERVLVGCRPGEPLPELSGLTRAMAECSREFFIAARNDPAFDALAPSIGVRAWTVVETAVHEALDDIAPAPPVYVEGPPARTSQDVAAARPRAPADWQMYFRGWADHAFAEQVAACVSGWVETVSEHLPLGALDGVTFADDLAGAVASLYPERTFDLETLAAELAGTLALRLPVERNGTTKVHLLFRGWLGARLVAEDATERAPAQQALVFEFAQLASLELIAAAFPHAASGPIGTPCQSQLFAYAGRAWSGYFAARSSAVLGPELGAAYLDQLVSTLNDAPEQIRDARARWLLHRSFPKLAHESLQVASNVLTAAGLLAGHFDSLGQTILDPNDALGAALRATGLQTWFEHYREDLRELWQRRGAWCSVDELFVLNRHARRLLWPYGLYHWETDDGDSYLNILPDPTGVARLPRLIGGDLGGRAKRLLRNVRQAWRRVAGRLRLSRTDCA